MARWNVVTLGASLFLGLMPLAASAQQNADEAPTGVAIHKEFPKSVDRDALSYLLYEQLFKYAAVNVTTHDRHCPRGVCSGIALSEQARSHGDTVKLVFSLRIRSVSINDGKNSVAVRYELPNNLREYFSAAFQLEDGVLARTMSSNSFQAVLYEALPKTESGQAALADKYGNSIVCRQGAIGTAAVQSTTCKFSFAQ